MNKKLDTINATACTEALEAHKAIQKRNPIEYTIKMGEMLRTVNRAGAGGTKSGIPGMRPNGLEYAEKCREYWTPKGLLHKPPHQNPKIKDDGVKRDAPPLEVLLPLNFCASCNEQDKRPEDLSHGDYRMVGLKAGLEHLRIYPGHIVLYYMCKRCDNKRRAELNAAQENILLDENSMGPKQSIMYAWAEKAWENAKWFINRAWANRDNSIFVGRKLRGEII